MKWEGAIRPFNKATFVFLKAEGVHQINRTSECWLHEKYAFCCIYCMRLILKQWIAKGWNMQLKYVKDSLCGLIWEIFGILLMHRWYSNWWVFHWHGLHVCILNHCDCKLCLVPENWSDPNQKPAMKKKPHTTKPHKDKTKTWQTTNKTIGRWPAAARSNTSFNMKYYNIWLKLCFCKWTYNLEKSTQVRSWFHWHMFCHSFTHFITSHLSRQLQRIGKTSCSKVILDGKPNHT